MEILLTKGYIATVDDIDSDLDKMRWHIHERKTLYAIHGIRDGKNTRSVFMHRIILARILGRALVKGEATDHINGNGLDNRRCNLRLATQLQNNHNRIKLKLLLGHPTSSKYKGVRWEPSRHKWHASININGKKMHLGRFKTEIEAANAYDAMAKEHFGEFARLNDARR